MNTKELGEASTQVVEYRTYEDGMRNAKGVRDVDKGEARTFLLLKRCSNLMGGLCNGGRMSLYFYMR